MKIGFENLRSLKKIDLLEIKPLTFLLGKNSSGKSTFLRAFPLLRQSVESNTKGSILWYGAYVDFGDFNTAIHDSLSEEDKYMKFKFNIPLSGSLFPYISALKNNSLDSIKDFTVELTLKPIKDFSSRTTNLRILFNDFQIDIDLNQNDAIKVEIDGVPSTNSNLKNRKFLNSFLPLISWDVKDREYYFEETLFNFTDFFQKAASISPVDYKQNTLMKIWSELDFGSQSSLFTSFTTGRHGVRLKNEVAKNDISSKEYLTLKASAISTLLPILTYKLNEDLINLFKSIYYIAPLRAVAERYYRPQDLNINEVDFEGKNLALVLMNFGETEKKNFKKWCLEYFNFYPEATLKGGNISIYVNFKDSSSRHNITDLGFGFSQLLPIITQIWLIVFKQQQRYRKKTKKIFVIEQPELHLHPKLQGKLISALIGVINFCQENNLDIKFLIETHSETIINSVGNRIYKKSLSNKDVSVYIFDRKDSVTEVKDVEFNQNGSIQNWPFGFFEEDF